MTDLIRELSVYGKVFYYGSTAYLKYKNRNIKIYKILTDINVAKLSQIIKNIEFSRYLDYDCISRKENTFITFLIEENEEQNDFEYLKRVNEKYDNFLFSFFYKPQSDKFFIFKNNLFSLVKNHKIFNLMNLTIENALDIAYLCSELSVDISDKIKIINDEFNLSQEKIIAVLPFLEMILTGKRPYYALILLSKINLLDNIFPFLKKLKGVMQDRYLHPEGDVYTHTINCFYYLKNPSLKLAYGLLLHDYGKWETKEKKGFHGHSLVGSKSVKKILLTYGYDENFIKDVEFLVEYHMVNSYFNKLTDEQKSKIFNNELGVELLKLFKADLMGSIGRLDSYLNIIASLKKIQNKIFRSQLKEEVKNLNPY